jgi:hypothetical protein
MVIPISGAIELMDMLTQMIDTLTEKSAIVTASKAPASIPSPSRAN